MPLLSNLYDIADYKRGQATLGWVRPTIKQFFTSAPDFEQVASFNGWTNEELFEGAVTVPGASEVTDAAAGLWYSSYPNPLLMPKPLPANSGKWYWEVRPYAGNTYCTIGITQDATFGNNARYYNFTIPSLNFVLSVVVDMDAGNVDFYRNGTYVSSAYYMKKDFITGFPMYLATWRSGGSGATYYEGFFDEASFNYPSLFNSLGAQPYNMVP